MASIRKEVLIEADAEDVWDAVRDVGALHTRLVPGFVTDTRLETGARVVTFFNGAVARELLVAVDEQARRLVWAVVDGPLGLTHHNASAQVFVEAAGRTRFVWTADVLPHEAAGSVDALMERGIATVKRAMESPQSSV